MHFFDFWWVNLIGYYIFVVIFYQFYKLAVRNTKHDGASTILLQSLGGLSILALAPFFPLTLPTSWVVYALLIIASIFYALTDRLNTTARKNLEVSTFSIIGQISTVFLILFGFVMFRESFVASKVMGAMLIIAANAWLFYKKGYFQVSKYTWLAIISAATFATAISIDIGISEQFNLPFYIMFTLIVPALMTYLVERIPLKQVISELKGRDQKYYLITGIAWGLAIFFSLRAFQFGSVTTIVPLQAVQVLLNVAVAYFFLKETDNKVKKVIAAVLVIIGVYLTVR